MFFFKFCVRVLFQKFVEGCFMDVFYVSEVFSRILLRVKGYYSFICPMFLVLVCCQGLFFDDFYIFEEV